MTSYSDRLHALVDSMVKLSNAEDAGSYNDFPDVMPPATWKPARGYVLFTNTHRYALKYPMLQCSGAGYQAEFFSAPNIPRLLERLKELTAQNQPVAVVSEQLMNLYEGTHSGDELMLAAKEINPRCSCIIYTVDPHTIDPVKEDLLVLRGVHIHNSMYTNFPTIVAQINKDLNPGQPIQSLASPAKGYLLITHDPHYSLAPFMAKFTKAGFETEFFPPRETSKLLERLVTLIHREKPVAIISEQDLLGHGSPLDENALRIAAKKIDPKCFCVTYEDPNSYVNHNELPRVGRHVLPCLEKAWNALVQRANQSKLQPQAAARPSVVTSIARRQPSWVEPPRPTPGYPHGYPMELRKR